MGDGLVSGRWLAVAYIFLSTGRSVPYGVFWILAGNDQLSAADCIYHGMGFNVSDNNTTDSLLVYT